MLIQVLLRDIQAEESFSPVFKLTVLILIKKADGSAELPDI